MADYGFVGQIKEQPEKARLDLLDRKILFLLCKNGRYSDTAIAKALRVKRETVGYRLKRMVEKDFLHGFLTLVDSRRLGFRMHLIYVKLKQLNSEQMIIEQLMKFEDVTRLKNCGGSYDLQIVVTSKSLEQFDTFLDSLLSRYHEYIQDYVVLEIIEENFTGIGMLLNPSEKQNLKIAEKKGSTFEAEFTNAKRTKDVIDNDEKDKQILKLLRLNSRMPLAELSKKVKLAVPAVENRVKRLIREEVVKCFVPLASLAHLGYQWYKVFFQVKNIDKKKFINYLKYHSNVLWYIKFAGNWNYQFSIFAKDNTEFNKILNEIRTQFADNIISYDSIIVFNQYKFVHRVD